MIKRRNNKMTKETFSIPNISCGHCVMTIKKELTAMDGIKAVEGDPANKSISVEWEAPATRDKIKETLKEINYPAS
jgi:copper chaperone